MPVPARLLSLVSTAMKRLSRPVYLAAVGLLILCGILFVVAPSPSATSLMQSNQAPTFDGTEVTRSVAENSPAGTPVGDTITATDPEGTTLTYSLEGADADTFAVDTTGQLSVGAGVQLDYETQTAYEVTLRATDAMGAGATVDVAVSVTDVNDPNIIMIMADDAGFELFGPYGTTQYSTPHIDRIAAAGTTFTNAYAHPMCTPTRVALMTGKYGDRNYTNWHTLPAGSYTFADYFHSAGYATAITGKWQLEGLPNEPIVPLPGTEGGDGFDTYCLWDTGPNAGSHYWNPKIKCDGVFIDTIEDDYGPDIFVDFAADFIEENQKRPFFLYYPMVLPHTPLVLPPGTTCTDPDDRQCIYEHMVTRADHNVGRIYEKLESAGLLDNTVLVFTGDNGSNRHAVSELDGEIVYGDKGVTTNAGTKVPLVVWAPGQTGGRVFDDLISFTDFLPTFADAVGVELPEEEEFNGVSFWERLQGNSGAPREWLYMYYFSLPYVSSRNIPYRSPQIRFIRDKRYKLYGTGEFYDLEADPDELHPLPDDHAESSATRSMLQTNLNRSSIAPKGIEWWMVRRSRGPRPRNRPALSGAEVDRSVLTLNYTGILEKKNAPPADSFVVGVDGTPRDVTAVSLGYHTVTLTLGSRVYEDEPVSVSYTPGANPIMHLQLPADHHALAFAEAAVENVTPPNRAPVVSGPATAAYIENGSVEVGAYSVVDEDGDDTILSLSGPDQSRFVLSERTLRFLSTPDFESPTDTNRDNAYEVTVVASDGRLEDSRAVTVTVSNVDEAGVLRLSSVQPQVGTELGVDLEDPDASVTATRWVWEKSASRGGGWTTIESAAGDGYTPTDDDRDQFLRITVSYADGEGVGKTARTVTDNPIQPAPVTNTPPDFASESGNRQVEENTLPGLDIGDPVVASDPGDTLTYNLEDGDAALFDVDEVSGQLQTKEVLDYETQPSHTMTVTATDTSDASADITVRVTVINLDEEGMVTLTPLNRPKVDSLISAGVSDPDGGIEDLAWRWERSPNGEDWSPIPGADSAAYTPTSADTDQYLKAIANYRDNHGPTKTADAHTSHSTEGLPPPSTTPPTQDNPGGNSGGGGGGGAGSGGGGTGIGGGADGFPPRSSDMFADITPGVWYEPAVTWMILHGITAGCATSLFCPDQNLTRQQFVTFLWRAAGRPTSRYQGSEAFGDVLQGTYAEESIGWAVANGITKGCTAGQYGNPNWRFCPTHQVTRGQMAALLYRHTQATYRGGTPIHTDVQPTSYYATGISWLTDFGAVPGCAPNQFCPNRNATRAEAAVFINAVAIRPHIWGEGNTSFLPQPN